MEKILSGFYPRFAWANIRQASREDWAAALTCLMPVLLVLGRAEADIATSLVALIFLYDCAVARRWHWVRSGWAVAGLALWFYGLVRNIFPMDSANFFAAFAWLRYILFAGCVTQWVVTDKKNRFWLVQFSIYACLFMAIDGLVQYIFGYDVIGNQRFQDFRLTSVFDHPILGITIANLFALPIFWLVQQKKLRDAILLFILCFTTVFLSGDRMGLVLAAAIALVWVAALAYSSGKAKLVLPIAFCFVAALVILAPKLAHRQIETTANIIGHIENSAYGRAWNSAWQIGRDHPLFGVGMKQFRNVCPDERYGPLIDPVSGYSRCYVHPHNAYMEWLSEEGFIGLFGFCVFALTVIVGLARQILRRRDDIVLWGLATMLAVRLAPLFVGTSFFNNWSAIPFWLALGWALGYPSSTKKAP